MLRPSTLVAALLLCCTMVGCGPSSRVKGQYYLTSQKYEEGVAYFRASLATSPGDATGHYYLGRLLLALGEAREASRSLDRANMLVPAQADIVYWRGAALDQSGERAAAEADYQRAVELDPSHIQARLALAESLLDRQAAALALSHFEAALAIDPDNRQGLFGRGAALAVMGPARREKEAWLAFLTRYPEGDGAVEAAARLNSLGGFEYRPFNVCGRTLCLQRIPFAGNTAKIIDRAGPLELIGQVMAESGGSTVTIVAYKAGDQKLARKRAESVRDYILRKFPEIEPSRLKVDWSDSAERIPQLTRDGQSGTCYLEQESVAFITTPRPAS